MILSEACATTVSGLEPSSFVLAFNDTTKEKYLNIIMETSMKILSCAAKPLNLMHLSMASPTPPPPGLDGEIVGIWQSSYHVKNCSAGALSDVNTPIYRQESIGDW